MSYPDRSKAEWESLNDDNNRYEARQLNVLNYDDRNIIENVREVIDTIEPPTSERDKSYRERFRNDHINKPEVTLVKDKLTGSTVALASVYGRGEGYSKKISQQELDAVKKTSPEILEEYAIATNHKMRAFVLDQGKVDPRKLSENDADAKKVLGLSEDAQLAGGVVPDIDQWEIDNDAPIATVLSAKGIQKDIESQEKAPRVEFPGTKGDTGIAVHNAMMDSYFEKLVPEVQEKASELRQMEVDRFNENIPLHKEFDHFKKFEKLNAEVANLQTEAYKGLVNPAHFIRDPHREIGQGVVFSDGVDLTNNWAGLKGDETTPLNDVEQKFSIGKVDPEMTKASPNIKEGEKVTGSIRLVNNETGDEYNFYSIESKTELSEQQLSTIYEPSDTAGWIRIDKIENGKPVAYNEEGLKDTGLELYQLPMGTGQSESARETVTPEIIRRNISESSINAHNDKYKPKSEIGEGVVKFNDYLGKTGQADVWDNDKVKLEAAKTIAESHFHIKRFNQKEADLLQDLRLAKDSNLKPSENFEFVRVAEAWSISKRGERGNEVVFGQSVSKNKPSYHGAYAYTSLDEFHNEIAPKGKNEGKVVKSNWLNNKVDSIDLGNLKYDQRSYMNPDKFEYLNENVSVVDRNTGAEIHVSEDWRTGFDNRALVDAAMEEVEYNKSTHYPYTEKNENMFGLGYKHEALVALDKQNEAVYNNSLEATAPEIEPEQEVVSAPRNKGPR